MRFRLRLAAAAATAAACATLGLVGTGPASATIPGFAIANYLPEAGTSATPMCLRGPNTSGNDATIQVCDGSQYQTWHWVEIGGDSDEYAQLANGYDLCLGVAGGSDAEGANVVVSTCQTGHLDQYWEPDLAYDYPRGDLGDFYPFLNEESGLVLNVQDGDVTPGTDLTIWPFAFKANNQDWGGVSFGDDSCGRSPSCD
jgi:Ricin-type beta-trefoil lectin domain